MTTVSPAVSADATSSSLRGAVEALFRHRTRFLLVFGLGLLLTLLYVFASPKKYESDMSLLVQNARKPEVISAEATTSSQGAAAEVTEEELYSQVEILGSSDVLDEVVDPGWREVPVTSHPAEAQALHEQKVARLRKHLVVAPVRKSHVIDVSYRANSPQEATETLSRLLAIFIARQKDIGRPTGASHFFNEEAGRYQGQWSKAQQDLANFQQSHHLVSVADKETELEKAIADGQALERGADAEISEVEHRIAAESAAIASTPARQQTMQRVVPAAGSVDSVNTLLAQLTLRRAQLLTEYLPTDRIVQQVDSQIEEAQSELKKSQAMNSMETQTNVNPKYQAQDQALADDRAHLGAAMGRRSTIAAQLVDLENQLKTTERDSLEFTTLQQKVAALDTNQQLYVQKRDAAQISEAMDERGLLNVGIAQSPTFSLGAVRPRPLIDTFLGLLTSFFLASFAVYLAEAGRDTIATPAELDVASRYPVLATVGYGANDLIGEHLPTRATRSILTAVRDRAGERGGRRSS